MGDVSEFKAPTCDPVKLENVGFISGLQRPNGTRVFLGIPYAAPPVGDLRWQAPQPPSSWTGVRRADKFAPSSLQIVPPARSIYFGGETELSEDCLYLNVYTGSGDSIGRPVLVWLHFGAFVFGSSSNPLYNGTHLAAKGITVVTVNFRLGRFGFLAHPDLSAESEHNASGNYGIMDQIAALHWVQRNIHAFGGDPVNVTIGGVSAGAASVHILRCSPLAQTLFTKAICESGPGLAPTIDKGHGHVASYTTLETAEKAGVELMDILGVSSISALRRLPSHEILAATLPRAKGTWKSDIWPGPCSLSMFDTAYPVVDGYVLPESPLATFLSGKATDIPMIAGNVGNEASALPYLNTLDTYRDFITSTFGASHAAKAMQLYPVITDNDVRAASSQILADQVFFYSNWTVARASLKSKSPVWYYVMLRAPPIPADMDVNVLEKEFAGAYHAAGVAYGWNNMDAWPWNWTKIDRAIARDMSDSWVRFMRYGDPEGHHHHHQPAGSYPDHEGRNDDDDDEDESDTLAWPSLKSSDGPIMLWDSESRLDSPGPRAVEMTAFWDSFYNVEGQIDV